MQLPSFRINLLIAGSDVSGHDISQLSQFLIIQALQKLLEMILRQGSNLVAQKFLELFQTQTRE